MPFSFCEEMPGQVAPSKVRTPGIDLEVNLKPNHGTQRDVTQQ